MNIFYGHNKCKQDKKISCLKNYTQWLLYVSEGVKDVLKEKNLISDQQGYEKMPSIIRQALNNNNNNTNPPTPQPNQKTEKPLTVIPQFNSSQTELVYDEINTVYYPVRIIKDSNLTSQNIVKGVTIYGVTGTKECNNGGGTNPIELSTLTVPLNQMPTKTFNAPSNSAYNKVILQADVFQNKSLTLGSTLNGVYINCTIPQGSSPINLQTFNLYNNSFDSSDTIVAPQGTAYNRIVNHIPKYRNQQVSLGSTLNGLYLNCTVPQGGGGNTGLQPDSLTLSLNDLAYNNSWQPPYGKGYTSVNLNNVNKYLNTTVQPGQVLNGICYNVTVPNNPISPSINVIPYNKVVTSTSQLPNNEQAPSGSAYNPITVTIPSTHDIYNKSQVLTIGSLQNTSAIEQHVLEGFTFYLKNHANQLKFKTGTIPNRGTVEQSAPFEASNCYFQHIRITGGGSSGGGGYMSNSRYNLIASGGNIGNEIKIVSKEQFKADPSLSFKGFTISVQGGTYLFRIGTTSIGTTKGIFSSYESNQIIYPQNNGAFISDNNPTADFSSSKSGLTQSLWWMANFGRLSPPEGEYKVFNSAPYKAIVGGYNLLSAYEWKGLDQFFRAGSNSIWQYIESVGDYRVTVDIFVGDGEMWTTTPVIEGGQLKVWVVDVYGKNGVDFYKKRLNESGIYINGTKYIAASLYDGL